MASSDNQHLNRKAQ